VNNESLLFGAITFVSTMTGGFVATRVRKHFGLLEAFAAGVLIAVPLFDLLPESLELAQAYAVPFAWIFYAVAAGFLSLLVLERYFSVHRICFEDGTCRNEHHPKGGLFGAVELTAHSFMDGVAIGLGFQVDSRVGLIVAFAVIAHDFSDGINTVVIMLRYGNSQRASLRMLLLDAASPMLGVASTLLFTVPARLLVLALPFFAGGFFYMGSSDLLPEAHEKNAPLATVLFTLSGFVVIFVLTRILLS
jgi:zinc transporter ZupT